MRSIVVQAYDHSEYDHFVYERGTGHFLYKDRRYLLPIELAPNSPYGRCPSCNTTLYKYFATSFQDDHGHQKICQKVCRGCGYWRHYLEASADGDLREVVVARLKKFDLTDKNAPQREITKWLASHPGDIYYIHPFRVEEVIKDILADYLKVDFAMTAHSRDGGFDLVGFEGERGKILVEVKRHSPHRKIGVRFVRHLAGVLVRENARRGVIISTSDFTKGSRKEAKEYRMRMQDYAINIDLVRFNDLLPWLGVKTITSRSRFHSKRYWNGKFKPFGDAWIAM